MTERVPDWLLERYLLDELPPERKLEVEQRLAAEEGGMARVQALREADAEHLRRNPPRVMALQIEARRRRPAQIAAGVGTLMVLVAAVAAVALNSGVVSPAKPGEELPEEIRFKGDPDVEVSRKTARGHEDLADGAVAHQGDVLQIRYQSGGKPYGAVLSVDGRGAVTVHWPGAGKPVRLPSAGGPLDHAYELDDAPGFERFYFIGADAPFQVDELVKTIGSQVKVGADPGTLRLPVGLVQTSVHVRKEAL